jgi:hypothetical protein
LLSAGLAPSVKYVPAEVEVTQVRFGGAQGLEVREHVAQLRTNSLNIVTFLKYPKKGRSSLMVGGCHHQAAPAHQHMVI